MAGIPLPWTTPRTAVPRRTRRNSSSPIRLNDLGEINYPQRQTRHYTLPGGARAGFSLAVSEPLGLLNTNRSRFLLLFATCAASAGQISVTSRVWQKDATFYRSGEPMVFEIQLLEDSQPLEGKRLRGNAPATTARRNPAKASPHPLRCRLSPPWINPVLSASPPGPVDSRKLLLDDKQPIRLMSGAGVEPEKLQQGVPEPADFDSFWAAQKSPAE